MQGGMKETVRMAEPARTPEWGGVAQYNRAVSSAQPHSGKGKEEHMPRIETRQKIEVYSL